MGVVYDFNAVQRNWRDIMQAKSIEELRHATVLYCEALDQCYEKHGLKFKDDGLDNRRKRACLK